MRARAKHVCSILCHTCFGPARRGPESEFTSILLYRSRLRATGLQWFGCNCIY